MKLQLSIIGLLLVFLVSLLLSNSADPSSRLLFGLKRLQEKQFLNFKKSPEEQYEYKLALLNRRLNELHILVNKQQHIPYILQTSLRYSTTAGELTELVISNNLADQKVKLLETFSQHQKLLKSLINLCNQSGSSECVFITDDFNYLDLYKIKLQ